MDIRRISNLEEFENLRSEWTKLLAKNPVQDAFLTWEWLFAWWKHYGREHELWLITARHSDELVGIAPLMLVNRRKYGLRLRVLCNIGTPNVDVGGFIVRRGEKQIYTAISSYLIAQKKHWNLLELNEIPPISFEKRYLVPHFASCGFEIRQRDNSHFFLPLKGGWKRYWEEMPSRLRHELRRKERRLTEQCEITLLHHSGDEVSWQDVAAIFEINEHAHYPHMYRSAEEKAFQREIFELMKKQGWLKIYLFLICDQPVAFLYGFYYKKRFEGWRAGFDLHYAYYSIGNLLYLRVIQDCFQKGISEIDFLCGDEHYKTRWQTNERQYTQLRFVPREKLTSQIAFSWPPRLKALLGRDQ